MAAGSFALVLHGHVPYVLKHGRWPHGEQWLYEAAAETWLPLLEVLDACHQAGATANLTLGLTPILLEQLAHPAFKEGLPLWLAEREQRAHADERSFQEWGDAHLAFLARRQADRFMDLAERFEAIDRDLPGAFAALWRAGEVELISSGATHGYQPLLLHDASCRAQIRQGLRSSERILGQRPRGFWLPECAYRPAGSWTPPAVHGDARLRQGTDRLLADEGVAYTFVDAHLFRGLRSEGLLGPEGFRKVGWDQAGWDTERAWRSVLEPHLASSEGSPRGVSVFARHPEVSEQVWSGQVGYPADGRYLEFHKKHGDNGLRYWKVTSARAGLGDKDRYHPDDIPGAVYSHAQHFCAVVRSILKRHRAETGRHGVVVAPFDAELFGHWWHEGPLFLRDVLLTLHADPEVEVTTAGAFLDDHPADKVAWLPEGSWGEGGDHRVWFNDGQRWMWEVLYRAEDRFGALCLAQPWRDDPALRRLLEDAGRELLLLQASDWPFVVHTQGAPDYGIKRFTQHATRFDRICDMVVDVGEGRTLAPYQEAILAEARACDDVFPDVDLALWHDP
ncbi:MAG: DUF1957 domain-containing protein [Alphaproteobacteria bacterium]|nr:DUF1957 domain-containing protein [Alphaproteobacteria bacterium]